MAYIDDTSHMCWQSPEGDLFWFSGQKVKFGLQTFYNFHTITDFQFDIQWWYFPHVFPITGTRPLIMFGWKSPGQIFTLNFASFQHDNSITYWHTMMILYAWVHHDPRRTYWFLCQYVKGQGLIQTWNFVLFLHSNPITFLHTIMILHT